MLEKIGTTVAQAAQHLFDPQLVAEKARKSGFMERLRVIDPSQLLTSLVCSLAGGKVDSIAGLLRDHNHDQGKNIDYRAYHDRLSSPNFSKFVVDMLAHVAKTLSITALDWSQSDSLKSFRDIVIQDGTSFAVRNGLAEDFPGRFYDKSPAAVEVHVTMSLKHDTFTAATITPDTHSERDYLPAPETLNRCLLLADRGYDGIPYLSDVAGAGGSYIVRIRSTHDPIISSTGSALPHLKSLQGRLCLIRWCIRRSAAWC
jgi:hypothetical protein